jgi:hypothetical protein
VTWRKTDPARIQILRPNSAQRIDFIRAALFFVL